MHSPNAGYHGLGCAASTIDRHHGGEPRPAQPRHGIHAESCVLPHASAHARLSEFHDDSGHAADEKRERVLEHTPRDRVGRNKRGLASRSQEIEVTSVSWLQQGSCCSLQAGLQRPRQDDRRGHKAQRQISLALQSEADERRSRVVGDARHQPILAHRVLICKLRVNW